MKIELTVLALLYLAAGIFNTIGYLPTIKDLASGKKSANTKSYLLWTICSLITFLYVITTSPDFFLKTITGLTFASCTTILTFSLRLEKFSKTI